MKDSFKIIKQIKQLQERMETAQKELELMRFEGSSGGEAVKAVVNGSQQLLDLQISQSAYEAGPEMLQDLIISAVNLALEASRKAAANKIGSLTGGLLGP